jgi:hypothetical protein
VHRLPLAKYSYEAIDTVGMVGEREDLVFGVPLAFAAI